MDSLLRNYADSDQSQEMETKREQSPTGSSSTESSPSERKTRKPHRPDEGHSKRKKDETPPPKRTTKPRKVPKKKSPSSSSSEEQQQHVSSDSSSSSSDSDSGGSKSRSRSPVPVKGSRNGANARKPTNSSDKSGKASRKSRTPPNQSRREPAAATYDGGHRNKSPAKTQHDRKRSSPPPKNSDNRRRDRSKSRERERKTRDNRDQRDRERNRNRERSRERERDRDRERDRERERDRNRGDKDRSRNRHERDDERDRDRNRRDSFNRGKWNNRAEGRKDSRSYDRKQDDRRDRRSSDHDKDRRRSRRSNSRDSRNTRRRQSPDERASRARSSRSRSRSHSPPSSSVGRTPVLPATKGAGLLPTPPTRFFNDPMLPKPPTSSLLPTPPVAQALLAAASASSTVGIPALMSIPTNPPMLTSLIPAAVAVKLNLPSEANPPLPLVVTPLEAAANNAAATSAALLSRTALLRNTAKAAQLEKMGIDVLQQSQKAVDNVPLPSYYNPGVVNPVRYADQVQKRKLLWSHKTNESKEVSSNISKWEQAKFAQDTDGKVASKFLRLMGVKEPKAGEEGAGASPYAGSQSVHGAAAATVADVSVSPAAGGNHSGGSHAIAGKPPTGDSIKKQEELFSTMEQQYEVARQVTHTMRGVGLGFSSQARQF